MSKSNMYYSAEEKDHLYAKAAKTKQAEADKQRIPADARKHWDEKIPDDIYKMIVDHVPILCVDIIIKNEDGHYLLVKRANEPLKGRWWIIGGRIKKGESIEDAVTRKVMEEVGIPVGTSCIPLGYYHNTYHDSPYDIPIHTLSIVFIINLVIPPGAVPWEERIKLDSQSTDWKFASELPLDFRLHGSSVWERFI